MNSSTKLQERLEALTVEGELYNREDRGRLRCYACGHRCLIPEGRQGICKVRYNEDGNLRVPSGYVAGLQCDPTEKKPFYHVLPGSNTLTFGMLGCDLHCGYCQNWLTSQSLRDTAATAMPREITAEWAVTVFKLARSRGMKTGFVSNGNATAEVLDYLKPHTDCYKIDLKTMSDRNYRSLGGVLQNILNTIEMVCKLGIWMEIVTLVVPGWNSSDEELREAAKFLAGVSPNIPWHITAFHKDYKMTEYDNTTSRNLLRAAEIGREEGLHFVYAGNLPGQVGKWEDTSCSGCGSTLIERSGFSVQTMRVDNNGNCPDCARKLPGIWGEVTTPGSGRVLPLHI